MAGAKSKSKTGKGKGKAKEKGTASKLSNVNRPSSEFFLVKLYDKMLNDPECAHILSWAPDGRCMIVHDKDVLIKELRDRNVCKQSGYPSFARQMRIYKWIRVRCDDSGNKPWADEAKAWRHPVLHRGSTEEEIAEVVRTAPYEPKARRSQDLASPDRERFLSVPSADQPVASTSAAPVVQPAPAVPVHQLAVQRPAASRKSAVAPPPLKNRVSKLVAVNKAISGKRNLPAKTKGVGFYEDDMLFGGVEADLEDESQLLSRSPESQAMRALRLEMQGARRPGPKAPSASNHLARIDLTKAGPAELALPPIPPMSMALEDFPDDLYYNSSLVMAHAAENPMNFDHPWAALSQVQRLKQMAAAAGRLEQPKDISVPVLS